jgi:hypothetical protein
VKKNLFQLESAMAAKAHSGGFNKRLSSLLLLKILRVNSRSFRSVLLMHKVLHLKRPFLHFIRVVFFPIRKIYQTSLVDYDNKCIAIVVSRAVISSTCNIRARVLFMCVCEYDSQGMCWLGLGSIEILTVDRSP